MSGLFEVLFSKDGAEFLFRWAHYLAGITWIGILYYFNFIQGSWFKECSEDVKKAATQKLVPRALWWFRWGAAFTWISGVALLYIKGMLVGLGFDNPWGAKILVGALMGTFMAYNVWFVIWPAQKKVIAKANGEDVEGDVAAGAAQAGLASRTNTLFSIPLIYFMGAAMHFPIDLNVTNTVPAILVIGGLICLIEANVFTLKKMGPITSVSGVITSGFVLTIIVQALLTALL